LKGPTTDCYELRATLAATLLAAEDFVVRTRELWSRRGAGKRNFAIELLLRESLANAVLHGSDGDATKTIRCVLRMRPARFLLVLRDEGTGFDWRAAWRRSSGSGEVGGRGLEILRLYASRVRFNRSGNMVAIQKRFEEGVK